MPQPLVQPVQQKPPSPLEMLALAVVGKVSTFRSSGLIAIGVSPGVKGWLVMAHGARRHGGNWLPPPRAPRGALLPRNGLNRDRLGGAERAARVAGAAAGGGVDAAAAGAAGAAE